MTIINMRITKYLRTIFNLIPSNSVNPSIIKMKKDQSAVSHTKSLTFPRDQMHALCSAKYMPFSTLKQQSQPKKSKATQQKAEEYKFEVKCPKGTRDYHPQQMAIRRMVIDRIAAIFKKHGAVQIDTPVFQLKDVLTGKYGQDSKLIYDLEDQGGQKCALRYDLTVPFCRFMANNTNIAKIKRFHIGKVYRRDQPIMTKGRYREFFQCDFDIAGSYDPMLPDAEVLAIMQEILEDLDVSEFIVKVNHRKILECMVLEAGCQLSNFPAICSTVDKLDKLSWKEVRNELIKLKGCTQQQADAIGRFTQYRGQPEELLQKIGKDGIFTAKTLDTVNPIFEQMSKLFSYLKAFERIAKVSFDLSLARGLDYYTGLIYEIVLTDKKTQLGSISGGGRYDNLIGMFCSHQIPSVGGSIGIERLFGVIEKKMEGKVRQNSCQVLVATVGKIPPQTKLKVLGQLWKCGVKAETLYQEKAKPDKQLKHAFDSQIPLILWIGQDELKTGDLKLKILYLRSEVMVRLDNLQATIMPFIDAYRTDYAKGSVKFEDPAAAKKENQKKADKKKEKTVNTQNKQ